MFFSEMNNTDIIQQQKELIPGVDAFLSAKDNAAAILPRCFSYIF